MPHLNLKNEGVKLNAASAFVGDSETQRAQTLLFVHQMINSGTWWNGFLSTNGLAACGQLLGQPGASCETAFI